MNNLRGQHRFLRTLKTGLIPFCLLFVATSQASDLKTETISTEVGKSTLIQFNEVINRVAIGDPTIADYRVISNHEFLLVGKAIGSTNIIFWQNNGTTETRNVNVTTDIQALQDVIKTQLPQEHDIQISSTPGGLILSGTVSNALAADTAVSLTESHARILNKFLMGSYKVQTATSNTPANAMIQVINLLRIRDSQQVMLAVKIAEVNKKLLDKLSIGLNSTSKDLLLNVLTGIPSGGSAAMATLFPNAKNNIKLDAEHDDNLIKILAEPTIVSTSGQEASFLVGGKIFIPVTQSTGGVSGSAISLVEREYGVGLKFIPTVLDGGRIHLKVAPEVSEISDDITVDLNGNPIPSFTTRKVSSTVQIFNGEHLVIGGLLNNHSKASVTAFPVLGEIPILGTLFRSASYTSDKTELIIVVSPSLVESVQTSPVLPTDTHHEPSRTDFFLGGQSESH